MFSIPFQMTLGGFYHPTSLFEKQNRNFKETSLKFLKIETSLDKNLGRDSYHEWKLLPWTHGEIIRGRPIIDDPLANGSSFDIRVDSYIGYQINEYIPKTIINMKLIGDRDILMMLRLTHV